jgi:hypothetical protein
VHQTQNYLVFKLEGLSIDRVFELINQKHQVLMDLVLHNSVIEFKLRNLNVNHDFLRLFSFAATGDHTRHNRLRLLACQPTIAGTCKLSLQPPLNLLNRD